MIDIHHHCLPDVDDGPHAWGEAVEMCRVAAGEGIETIIATPHVLRGRWRTFAIPELQSRLDELQSRAGRSPRLILGSEYFFAHDFAEVLAARNAIVPLAGSRYVLVELASNSVPPMIEQPFYRVQLEGWTPVIAHPERNLVFQAHPDVLAALVEHGARTQVTLGSLTGAFGPAAKASAEELLRRQLVHFVATDAHNTGKRPPRIQAELAALRALVGTDVADALATRNPRAIVENRPLEYDPEPLREEKSGFFTRVRRFFQR